MSGTRGGMSSLPGGEEPHDLGPLLCKAVCKSVMTKASTGVYRPSARARPCAVRVYAVETRPWVVPCSRSSLTPAGPLGIGEGANPLLCSVSRPDFPQGNGGCHGPARGSVTGRLVGASVKLRSFIITRLPPEFLAPPSQFPVQQLCLNRRLRRRLSPGGSKLLHRLIDRLADRLLAGPLAWRGGFTDCLRGLILLALMPTGVLLLLGMPTVRGRGQGMTLPTTSWTSADFLRGRNSTAGARLRLRGIDSFVSDPALPFLKH